MAVVSLDIIKSWFKRGLKPTESQFANTYDSFWHKLDMIGLSAIDGLTLALNGKANANHGHEASQITGLEEILIPLQEAVDEHEVRIGAIENALTDLPPPANYMLEIDTAPTYVSGRIKIIKYRYVSDAAKKYEERFSYDTIWRVAFVELKDDVSGKWVRRTYSYSEAGELLLPEVEIITEWSII